MYTREQIEKAVKAKNYKWFEGTKVDYDVNIVAVRTMSTGKKVTNKFDDWITISYKVNGEWKFHCWKATTDPGTKAVKEFSNPRGVARLIPNQYRSAYTIRKHAGKYDAVCQAEPVSVWRDKNKDMSFDEVTKETGVFGINIHRSNPKTESEYVENWSEGCMVFKAAKDFNQFMEICYKAREIHGNKFTLTLLESTDVA